MKDEPHGNDIEHLRAKPADIVERLRVWPTIEVASVVERKLMSEAADEIERLHKTIHEAFMAMCAHRDSPDDEVFQDAIDTLGLKS